MFPNGETVTRLRATPKIDYYSGEPVGLDWSAPDELVIDGCAVVPVSSEEAPTVDRDKLSTMATLRAPYGSDVKTRDRIRQPDGTVWEVDGHPSHRRNPYTGWEARTVANLVRIEVNPT